MNSLVTSAEVGKTSHPGYVMTVVCLDVHGWVTTPTNHELEEYSSWKQDQKVHTARCRITDFYPTDFYPIKFYKWLIENVHSYIC